MKWLTALVPYVAAGASMSALWVALIQRRDERRLKEAQASLNYEQLAASWINRLQDKIKSLEDEIVELKKTIQGYQEKLADVYARLIHSDRKGE